MTTPFMTAPSFTRFASLLACVTALSACAPLATAPASPATAPPSAAPPAPTQPADEALRTATQAEVPALLKTIEGLAKM